jgi:hypothetical protein
MAELARIRTVDTASRNSSEFERESEAPATMVARQLSPRYDKPHGPGKGGGLPGKPARGKNEGIQDSPPGFGRDSQILKTSWE